VIYGPPGIGKTSTLIEAIWHLYKSNRGKILVCVPSNAATDHILEKLVSICCLFFRMNAPTRKINNIKPSLMEFCFYKNNMEFRCPSVKALKGYKIVISTNMCSTTLWEEGPTFSWMMMNNLLNQRQWFLYRICADET
jgi:hypothetical protein